MQKASDKDLWGDNEVFVALVATEVTQEAHDGCLVLRGNQSDGGFERGLPDDVAEVMS